jgi:hypothetical protein
MNYDKIFGFTFYGGLSLAVYETGIVCSLLRLLAEKRNFDSEEPNYQFLKDCKYAQKPHFKFDEINSISDSGIISISGASAGSLAGFFFVLGLNLPYKLIPKYTDKVLNLWLKEGDISSFIDDTDISKSFLLNNFKIKKILLSLVEWCKNEINKMPKIKPLQDNLTACNFHISITHYNSSETSNKRIHGEVTFNNTYDFSFDDVFSNDFKKLNSIVELICVSSAFPCVFPVYSDYSRHEDEMNHFGDGGITDNKPITPVVNDLSNYQSESNLKRYLVLANPGSYKLKPNNLPRWERMNININKNIPYQHIVFNMLLPALSYKNIYNELDHISEINNIANYVESFDTNIIDSLNDLQDNFSNIFARVLRSIEDLQLINCKEKIYYVNELLREMYELIQCTNQIYGEPCSDLESLKSMKSYLLSVVHSKLTSFQNTIKFIKNNTLPSIKNDIINNIIAKNIKICPLTPLENTSGSLFIGFGCFLSEKLRKRDFKLGYLDGLKYIGNYDDNIPSPSKDDYWINFPSLAKVVELIPRPEMIEDENIYKNQISKQLDQFAVHMYKKFFSEIEFRVRFKLLLWSLVPSFIYHYIKNKIEQGIHKFN